MARIRYIKPQFFEDETLGQLSILARYIYIGLWCFMDRNGIIENSEQLIKSRLFPFDEMKISDIKKALNDLIDSARLIKFDQNGKKLLLCPNFKKHQHVHPREVSKFSITDEEIKSLGLAETSLVKYPTSRVGNGVWCMGNGELVTDTGPAQKSESFDFEVLYKKYPKKIGKKKAFEKLKATIKTKVQYESFAIALDRYIADCQKNKTEIKFYKNFDTFVNSWDDWLDPEAGTGATPREKTYGELLMEKEQALKKDHDDIPF